MLRYVLAMCCAASGALAQDDDPMALQRCIWRCLADSPGASSSEYRQCVAQFCSEGETPRTSQPVAGGWRSGVASDGRTFFAGIDSALADGSGLFYMCDRVGQSYLMLLAVDAPPGLFRLRIGSRDFPLQFDKTRQQLTSNVSPRFGVLEELASGQSVTVMSPTGNPILHVGLSGSRQMIETAYRGCGR